MQLPWHKLPKNEAHKGVLDYVRTVERNQWELFNKFVQLEAMYDPYAYAARTSVAAPLVSDRLGIMQENLIASNVDTVTAIISATDVRARFQTDDADWSTQRRAKHLEWYSDGLNATYHVDFTCRRAFRDCALKGTGVVKVYADQHDQLCIDRVLIDDIVVDELQCRAGKRPRQLHQRQLRDREELVEEFPKNETAIRAAQTSRESNWELWAGYRPVQREEVVVIESWYLGAGKIDAHGNFPNAGRHTIVIDGCTLVDEEWSEGDFPFVAIVWSERANGYYGISLAERIAGHQRTLNKRNWQIDRQLDQGAIPTTWVRQADANIAVRSVSRIGTIGVYFADKPETVIPPAVSGETYQNRIDTKNSAFEESGVSRMTAQASKPSGIDSGVALREYRDQTTQRFSLQEKGYEALKLMVILKAIATCKRLGDAAPKFMRRSKFGKRSIEWSQVDMGDVAIQIAAASTLSRTPAGRMQTVLEWAQAGVISMDEARRLLKHPDLERAMSVYTEALENIEEMFEEIADGRDVVPEPYQNMRMLVWRGQMQLMIWKCDNAPETVLDALSAVISQAAWIISQGQAANANAQPGAAPAASSGPAMPGAAATPTDAGVAAFAPAAMNAVA